MTVLLTDYRTFSLIAKNNKSDWDVATMQVEQTVSHSTVHWKLASWMEISNKITDQFEKSKADAIEKCLGFSGSSSHPYRGQQKNGCHLFVMKCVNLEATLNQATTKPQKQRVAPRLAGKVMSHQLKLMWHILLAARHGYMKFIL